MNDTVKALAKSARELLDKGYVTTRGALFFLILNLKELGIEEIDPHEVVEILGISGAAYYKAKRAIQEKEGWDLKSTRGIRL